jgi:class 3 adenylate cyclase
MTQIGDSLRQANRSEGMVRSAQALRRFAPGGDPETDPVFPGRRTSDRVARLIAEVGADQPSALRELGITGVQVWQSLVDRKTVGRDKAELSIAFTDLVGFSSWALRVGDDQVLRLLREFTALSEKVVSRYGGTVVKSLGDGVMAVFPDAGDAILACHEMTNLVSAVTIEGYRPQLRAGVHTGHPRVVRRDYLGVDVNIAARVADAAAGGEVLVSGPALEKVDPEAYTVRRRRFRAKGAPADLQVYSVVPRLTPPSTAS